MSFGKFLEYALYAASIFGCIYFMYGEINLFGKLCLKSRAADHGRPLWLLVACSAASAAVGILLFHLFYRTFYLTGSLSGFVRTVAEGGGDILTNLVIAAVVCVILCATESTRDAWTFSNAGPLVLILPLLYIPVMVIGLILAVVGIIVFFLRLIIGINIAGMQESLFEPVHRSAAGGGSFAGHHYDEPAPAPAHSSTSRYSLGPWVMDRHNNWMYAVDHSLSGTYVRKAEGNPTARVGNIVYRLEGSRILAGKDGPVVYIREGQYVYSLNQYGDRGEIVCTIRDDGSVLQGCNGRQVCSIVSNGPAIAT